MSAHVRRRMTKSGLRFQVRYRTGGRSTPLLSAGTFLTLAEAEHIREKVSLEIARVRAPQPQRQRERLVYIAELGRLLKIGVSIDPERRCRVLQAELLHVETGGFARERELHARFAHLRVRGEFFKPGSSGEIRRYIRAASRRMEAAA
jgi:hypothetical protein